MGRRNIVTWLGIIVAVVAFGVIAAMWWWAETPTHQPDMTMLSERMRRLENIVITARRNQ